MTSFWIGYAIGVSQNVVAAIFFGAPVFVIVRKEFKKLHDHIEGRKHASTSTSK